MKVGLKKIAEMAGVSVTTVSMVLRDCPVRVSLEKLRLIKSLAVEYDYSPNYAAVSLVNQKTKTIGVIVPDIENVFFSSLVKRLSERIMGNGYSMLLCQTAPYQSEDEQIEVLRRRNVDGILFALSFDSLSESSLAIVDKLNKLSIPKVALDTHLDTLNCTCVGVNHFEGSILATEHLVGLGHRRIAFLAGPDGSYSTRKRLEGYQYVLSNHAIEFAPDLVVHGNYSFDLAYEKSLQLLKKNITAVFATNDMMAYGVIKAAYELGIKIPEDISLVGFDDIIFSAMTSAPLTTVRQPIDAIATIACERLFHILSADKIENSENDINKIYKVEPRLIVRESTIQCGKDFNKAQIRSISI